MAKIEILHELKINEAIELYYKHKLAKITKQMINEYNEHIIVYYRKHRDYIVGDANPIAGLEAIINKIGKTWYKEFAGIAEPISEDVITQICNDNDTKFKQLKNKNPFLLKGSKDLQQRTKIVESSIAENVGLIKSIPQDFHTNILGSVMRAIASGGNLSQLYEDLNNLNHKAKDRIELIARDQVAKATAYVDRQNLVDNGLTKAIWKKSIAGKTHRKSHADADGKEFDLTVGCLIDGKYILPRTEINCKCSYRLQVEI